MAAINTESQQQIAREAATECLAWLESDNDPFTKGEREKCEEIIRSAIERAHQDGWHEGRDYEAKFGIKTQPAEAGKLREQQVADSPWREWTPEYVSKLIKDAPWPSKVIALHVNAALAAERQRREQADKSMAKLIAAACVDRDNYKRDLLSTQAAIDFALQKEDDHPTWLLPVDVEEALRCVDLSLLHQHAAEVRKPLVDALEAIAKAVHMGEALQARHIALDELAKVKEVGA